PANKLRDTLQIVLFNTPDIKTDSVRIKLKLFANENFETKLQKFGDDLLTSLDLFCTAVLTKPDALNKWWDCALGDFSPEKLYLISDLLDIPITQWQEGFSISELSFMGVKLKQYLKNQAAKGDTVYNSDGSPMMAGPCSN